MSKRKTPPARMMFVAEEGTVVPYVEFDGKRIAKRYLGGRWISLEPGYTVRGSEPGGDSNSLTIEYNPETAAGGSQCGSLSSAPPLGIDSSWAQH